MARSTRNTDPDTTTTEDTTPDAVAPAEKPSASDPQPDDVLCYIDRLGARAFLWNERDNREPKKVGGAVIPTTRRVRLEPGLSFCPGWAWAHVRGTPAWDQLQRLGVIRAVAGHNGDLASEWSRAKSAALVGMLAKTFHIPALERLRDLEASAERPRLDVAQEIDARLDEMGEKVKAHQAKRRQKRRANRRQVLG